jgi:hypothetical protein
MDSDVECLHVEINLSMTRSGSHLYSSLVDIEALVGPFSLNSTLEPGLRGFIAVARNGCDSQPPFSPGSYYQP